MLPVSEDSLVVIGGRDEYGVPKEDICEFNLKLMKSMPTNWKLSARLSGFASCPLKSTLVFIL